MGIEVLVPIFVCVVLPVAIVAIVFAAAINNDNKRAKVLIKAIEANNSIDADKLAEALNKSRRSPRQVLYSRLLWGCIFSLIGVVLEIVAIIAACLYDTGGSSSENIVLPGVFGGISLAVGVSFLIVYFVSRKQLLSESNVD